MVFRLRGAFAVGQKEIAYEKQVLTLAAFEHGFRPDGLAVYGPEVANRGIDREHEFARLFNEEQAHHGSHCVPHRKISATV